MDTFHREGFGGSGRVGNLGRFRDLQLKNPEHDWILAGGIGPENVGPVLAESAAKTVDVNSGVEAAPGIKDHNKMKQLVLAVHRARTGKPG